ncbi:MAG: hypothetical protein EBX41_09315 [Chitinophagia bacterium]|nr:hypothetical protein [Chitinophagia bacterium]
MNFKYTSSTLKKIEDLIEHAGFSIRYEKGHFQTGYCLIEQKRVIVVNKFLNTEGRINALYELLTPININEGELSGEMQKWYRQLVAMHQNNENKPILQAQIAIT